MFENFKVFKTEVAGRPFTVETGKMAGLSGGSCLVRYGDTTVLVNATASEKPRDGIDFFPLSVDFEEKLYAVGKIPGSFMKREGRPSETAVLSSRVVDRSIRPLFPDDMRNDVSVVMTVLSVDPDNSPEIAGLIGTGIALAISDIPFAGPLSGISIGAVDGEPVLNPTAEQKEVSQMEVTLAATTEKMVMIEAGANEVSEELMLKGLAMGHSEIKKINAFIEEIQKEIGKEKFTYESITLPTELFEAVKEFAIEDVRKALDTDDKTVRDSRLLPVKEAIKEKFLVETEEGSNARVLDECIYKLQKYVVREWLYEGKRVDGRGLNDMRPLAAEVALIPRVHGSGMFTRGQTQALTIATLGSIREAQLLDGIYEEENKRYMHHYNFPSYSVGETRPSRGPGRREIGHGALAEKALVPVLPTIEEFPYAIRLVSEILSSNGSTSQASICASTLALMDAGVPIKAPVAGISCGLIFESEDKWETMVDIQGLEDFFGDMDFKVGGTHKGITAIQVDIKVDGLTMEIVAEALEKTKKARLHILDNVMAPAIAAPREELSEYAPKMISMQIHPDKIREVIGSGGKVIQKICADFDVKVDIDDDGKVFVSGVGSEGVAGARDYINSIVLDPEVGAIYKGKVTRLMNFGAFVEIAPGKEGLVHVSKLDTNRVEKVEDFVSPGDELVVKVVEIDQQGRINLSRKDALKDIEAKKKQKEEAEQE